jgi:hypothetical protein
MDSGWRTGRARRSAALIESVRSHVYCCETVGASVSQYGAIGTADKVDLVSQV